MDDELPPSSKASVEIVQFLGGVAESRVLAFSRCHKWGSLGWGRQGCPPEEKEGAATHIPRLPRGL